MVKLRFVLSASIILFCVASCERAEEPSVQQAAEAVKIPDGSVEWEDLFPGNGYCYPLSVELDSILRYNDKPVFFERMRLSDIYRQGAVMRAEFSYGDYHLDIEITESQYKRLKTEYYDSAWPSLVVLLTGFHRPRFEVYQWVDEEYAPSGEVVIDGASIMVLEGTLIDIVNEQR